MKKLYPKRKDQRSKYKIIGFDVETHTEENLFYMGGLYNEDHSFDYFYDQEEMIKHILSNKYHNKIISATNLGFDFNALFYNTPYWAKFKIIQVHSKLIACIYNPHKDLKITFIDTLNYVPFSVKIMGNILKIPKLKSPSCLGRLPVNEEEEEELLIYNKRDCEVTKKFMDFLQNGFYDYLGGELKLTVASTSMDIFQRNFLRYPISHEINYLKNETEKEFKDFLFSGYYGGRTETFTRGKINNMYCYDVNSLYPSVMINEYPYPKSITRVEDPEIEFFKYMGISNVDVYCPPMKYPYLPKKDKKLIFPTGYFSGTYTHFELQKAIKLGYKILKINKQYIYKKSFYPFKKFIYSMYNKRIEYKKQNSPVELLYKLVMNSSYGKFAQKRMQDIQFIDLESMNDNEKFNFATMKENKKFNINDDGKGFILDELECESSFVIPIFSIYTTAYARDVLYNYLFKYNALYCDTDSITTSIKIPESLELGKMKLEYDIIEGVLIKPKMYMYKVIEKGIVKDVIKLKGVPTKTKEVMDQIIKGGIISYTKFSKLRESLRGNYRPNTIKVVKKSIDLEDTKRVWVKSFDPFSIEESTPLYIDERQ